MTDEKEKELGYLKDTMDPGRTRKLTEKALEEKLQRNIALRRRKLGALTCKINEEDGGLYMFPVPDAGPTGLLAHWDMAVFSHVLCPPGMKQPCFFKICCVNCFA